MMEQRLHSFKLPRQFKSPFEEELVMQSHCLFVIHANLLQLNVLPKEHQDRLNAFVAHYLDVAHNQILLYSFVVEYKDSIRHLLSTYNRYKKLRIIESVFPKTELIEIAKKHYPTFQFLPPPSPCEYVEEQYCWSCWDRYACSDEWIKHGLVDLLT